MLPRSNFREEKARDALAFEPLPKSRWVTPGDKGITIRTQYSEHLSALLRSLPGAKWDAHQRQWIVPFSSSAAVRAALPEIDHLADEAKGAKDEETRRREAERDAKRVEAERKRQIEHARARSMPLRREHLVPLPNRPVYPLVLEAIGDDQPRYAVKYFSDSVAQIYASDGRGGWVKRYLPRLKDYSQANSIGSRGVMVTYLLEEGPIYYVQAPVSWSRRDVYFATVSNGKVIRMSEEEVTSCLER